MIHFSPAGPRVTTRIVRAFHVVGERISEVLRDPRRDRPNARFQQAHQYGYQSKEGKPPPDVHSVAMVGGFQHSVVCRFPTDPFMECLRSSWRLFLVLVTS